MQDTLEYLIEVKNDAIIENVSKYNKFKESLVFLNEKEFNKYVKKINSVFNFKEYKALEDLLIDYSIEDYDIIKDISINQNYYPKIREIRKKFNLIENFYIIPLINRKTGKKTVACPFPEININNFYLQEDIVLIDVNTIETILNKKILKNY